MKGERQRGPQFVYHALDARGAFAQHRPGFDPGGVDIGMDELASAALPEWLTKPTSAKPGPVTPGRRS